jgi:hypothetical protein
MALSKDPSDFRGPQVFTGCLRVGWCVGAITSGGEPQEDLKLQLEAVANLDAEEKKVIRSVIESMLLRHEAKRWSAG